MAIAPPFGENGGFSATTFYMFVPTTASDSGASFIAIFDPTNFDDADDPSSYSWRAEDLVVARMPTVHRVILIYTDLGAATITVTVSGTNDNGNVVKASQKIKIGTTAATGEQMTKFVDLAITAFRPRVQIDRAAGAGPVSIVSCTMAGEVEDVTF